MAYLRLQESIISNLVLKYFLFCSQDLELPVIELKTKCMGVP